MIKSYDQYFAKKIKTKKDIKSISESLQSENILRTLFWIGLLFFIIIFLIIFSDILVPFVAGLVLAYFLNPVVEFLEKIGFSRLLAIVMILLIAIISLILELFILVPILNQQLFSFINNVPSYLGSLHSLFAKHNAQWLEEHTGIDISTLQSTLNSVINQGINIIQSILPSLWKSGKALMNLITLCILTPVVAFYILLDWDRMISSIDSWIPRKNLKTIREIFREMNSTIARFIRGQSTVCFILASYYSIMLTADGLHFGLLIGIFIGLATFVPYIGSAIGFSLALTLSWLQYWPNQWPLIMMILCIFSIGQFLEGYVLQPKLVGSSVGLHPVWLMFSLFAFGYLFGFTGMLIAVPSAAAIGVLVRFALHSYLSSSLYK
ncbi:MAG: member of the PurR regulon [Candidatus Tokpelaia sp. JSC161]|jgi:predicted PurR-regulated permease PerM|nr:MAG: member of the PurR regulon [Candidatus Tokpelaia sp. JSC161]